MLNDLIEELVSIKNKYGDIPVVSSSNEDNIFTTDVFVSVEPISHFAECLYLEDTSGTTECWNTIKTSKNLFSEYIIHVGSNSPVLGDPGLQINGIEIPKLHESLDEKNLELRLDVIHKAFEKALNKD